MTKTRCKTCLLGQSAVWFVCELHSKGWTSEEISRELNSKFNVYVSERAIRRHIKDHAKNTSKSKSEGKSVDSPIKPGMTINEDGTGIIQSLPQTRTITDFSDILREMDLDPDEFEVIGSARVSKWQQVEDGPWLTSYRLNIQKKSTVPEEESLPALIESAKSFKSYQNSTLRSRVSSEDRTLVVVGGDFQVGKVGSRGDSVELIARMYEAQKKLSNVIETSGCSTAVWMDAGDIIEGFENTDQQQYTNDLSLMEQVDLAHTLELQFIEILSKNFKSVDVMSVPSNHAGWRKGKSYLGKPSDDWGIHIARRIEKELNKYVPDHNLNFHYSDVWKKSLNVDVQGFGLGLVHGDDVNKPEAISDWWMKQVHGAGPTALSDFLVHGHFHTFRATISGRSLNNNAQKWILGAPTLDNGSDWYSNGPGGSDSDPGLLTFVIEKGTGLTDLKLITL